MKKVIITCQIIETGQPSYRFLINKIQLIHRLFNEVNSLDVSFILIHNPKNHLVTKRTSDTVNSSLNVVGR